MVSFTATDASLNTVTVQFIIQVVDNQAPVIINCPSRLAPVTLLYSTNPGLPTALASWQTVSANDKVDGAHVVITQTSSPLGYTDNSLFSIGTTTISYTAVDAAGNTETCLFFVTVRDVEPPVLLCPTNQTILTASAPLAVTWTEPFATDNSDVNPTVASTVSSGKLLCFEE